MTLDSTDLRILAALQHDATVSTSELAERVGLSQSPCWRRISQLESDGVIRSRVALLSRAQLGLEVMVIVQVKLASHGWQSLPKFKQKVVSYPEVVQCFMVLGDTDFVLLVATRSIQQYNEFIQKRLSQIEGVHAIESRMVLEETKNTTELPLPAAGGGG